MNSFRAMVREIVERLYPETKANAQATQRIKDDSQRALEEIRQKSDLAERHYQETSAKLERANSQAKVAIEKAVMIEERGAEITEALTQLRALKDEIGAIELEAILRDIMQEDAPKLLKQLSDEILSTSSAQSLRQSYERALESATERLNEIKAEHERHYQNTKESLERRARESSQQIEQKATQASQQIEQKANELDTSMTAKASELGALVEEKKALVDSQHEAINTQLAKASLVAQEIREQSFQNEIAKTLMLARFDRAINIATLMDTTLTKAKIHLHEADIEQKRDEVESMMNEVELDRQEVAKAKNDAKVFIDRASNAQAHAEFNSFLEVI